MRWVVRVFGALVVLGVIAIGAVMAVPTDRIAQIAADRIEASTGRSVRIAGDIRPTLWPSLGVRAEAFEIGNPAWVDQGPLIAAEALSIRVPWRAVFAGQVEIEEVSLIAPQVTLVRGLDGRLSWDLQDTDAAPAIAVPDDGNATAATPEASGDAGPAFALSRAELRSARVTYIDLAADQSVTVTDLDADIALPATGLAAITATASVNATQIEVEAGIDGIDALLSGAVRPVTLALSWTGGRVGFDGRASLSPAAEGALTVLATDLDPLFTMVGQSVPDLPMGAGRERIEGTGAVTLTEDGGLYLRDGAVVLDDNALSLELDVVPGADRPMIRGTVQAEALRLPVAGPGTGEGGGTGAGEATAAPGWSRDRIDVSGLFAADADLSLSIGALDVGRTVISPVAARLANTNGRAVLDIDRAGVFGGTLAGQIVVNGRGGLSARTDVLLAGVQLSPLLGALADYDRLEGTGSLSLNVLGVGDDMATLMSSLDGEGDLAFGAGAILGLDIAGMIRNFDTSFQGEGARTVYDSITANYVISDGVLRNEDLRLDAPWGEVTGAGTVDIGQQTLDYRVIPGVLRDDQGTASIAVPVLITGPWASPSIRPDLAYLAEQELAAEAERLEAEAQARLAEEADRLEEEARQRANEVLGTDLQAGDTIEDAGDALEERLREEAADQLQRLLGGN